MKDVIKQWIIYCGTLSFIVPVFSADVPDKTEKTSVPDKGDKGEKEKKSDTAELPKDVPDYAKIFKEITGEDAAARQSAAKALMQSLDDLVAKSEKPYLKQLKQDVNSEKPEVRDPAISQIAGALDDMRKSNVQAFGTLMETLKSSDAKDRDKGRQILSDNLSGLMEVHYIEHFIDDLAASDEAVRSAAAKKLQEMGADAAPLLVSALDDERLAVKKGAADALKAMGAAAKDSAGDLAMLLDNDDKNERKLAASVLENLGPDAAEVVDDLVSYLDNDEKPVRRLAVNILKKIGAPVKEAASDLINYLSDDDKNTRACAEEVLVNLGAQGKDAVPALIEVLNDKAQDDDAHRRVANVLAAIGKDAKKAAEVLKQHQDTTDVDLKNAISEALKKIE